MYSRSFISVCTATERTLSQTPTYKGRSQTLPCAWPPRSNVVNVIPAIVNSSEAMIERQDKVCQDKVYQCHVTIKLSFYEDDCLKLKRRAYSDVEWGHADQADHP